MIMNTKNYCVLYLKTILILEWLINMTEGIINAFIDIVTFFQRMQRWSIHVISSLNTVFIYELELNKDNLKRNSVERKNCFELPACLVIKIKNPFPDSRSFQCEFSSSELKGITLTLIVFSFCIWISITKHPPYSINFLLETIFLKLPLTTFLKEQFFFGMFLAYFQSCTMVIDLLGLVILRLFFTSCNIIAKFSLTPSHLKWILESVKYYSATLFTY